ncbi:MAG: hypothetical protein ACLBM6_00105 [Cuspidothrix sp.]
MPRGTKKSTKKQLAENNTPGLLSILAEIDKTEEHLDIPTMETQLWDAACKIRGSTDAPKYKDFMALPYLSC